MLAQKTPLMYLFSDLTLYLRAIVGVSLVVSGVGMQREKQKEKKTQNEKKEKQREEIENKKKNPKKISVLEGKLKRRKKKTGTPVAVLERLRLTGPVTPGEF